MLKNYPNITSLISFTFKNVQLSAKKFIYNDDGTINAPDGKIDLVEESMQENRISVETNPIMHEYFATEEFHKIWMDALMFP